MTKKQIEESEKWLSERLALLKTQEEKDKLRFSDEVFYRKYNNYADIMAYINNLRTTFANMMKKETIGKTLEGKDMEVYTIHAPGAINITKPALWINAMQHCREWLTPPTALFSIEKFLRSYSTDPQVKRLLDSINIFYLPVLNVDGYLFTWNGSRMWRKNRRRNANGSFGVDLNRNWRSGFGGEGSSGVPSSETYRGTHALSEPETENISKFMIRHPQIRGSIDFHSYSQLNLRPWGKSRNPSPDETKLTALGKKMVDGIASVHRKAYQNIRSSGLYPASGIACDEFYENHKQMAYTIELRPTQFGGGGFAPPPTEILPTAQENWPAVLAVAEYVRTGEI